MKTGRVIKLRLGMKKWDIQKFVEKRERPVDSRGAVIMSRETGGDIQ